MRLRDLSRSHVAYAYRRLHILLLREGWRINHKRTYRLYTEENLTMRIKKPRRRRSAAPRLVVPPVTAPDQSWGLNPSTDSAEILAL